MKLATLVIGTAALAGAAMAARAATTYYAYNMTTRSDFPGVYLAPAGTVQWGKNQALNDDDKELDTTERLTLTGLLPGIYDVKLVDKKGKTCFMHGVVLGKERSFEVRDGDLGGCQ